MNKIYITLFFIFTCLYATVIAQNTIKGNIADASNAPLIGVTIIEKGSNNGTVSDLDGNYSINANPNGILIVSYVGYKTQEIDISKRNTINIVLLEDSKVLNDVVVVGYGTQKRKELTSAVVVIDEKSIKDRPMVTAAEALQGKAAGVQVVQPSGKPGGDIAVRVRGATSVLAGNEPLYVVDGVPTTDIRGLAASDIATMTVLKDASSSAIYGARAANGVVLITTKRGQSGTPVIRLNTYWGIARLRKNIEVLSTKKYRELMNEINAGSLDPTATTNTDWQNEVFGTGRNQSYQLSYSGGTDKARYFVSGNYLNVQGIARPAKFDRYSLRMNLDNQLKSWLKLSTNVNVLRSDTKDTPDNASSGRGGVIMSALNTPPFLNIYKKDGSGQYDPNPFQPSWENPVAYMKGPDQKQTDTRLFGNSSLEVTIVKGLTAKTNFGADINSGQWDYYLDPFRTNYGRNLNGLGQSNKSNFSTLLWENTLNYSKSIRNHNFSILGGSSAQKYNYNLSYLSGSDFPSDTQVKTLNAANTISGGTRRSNWALLSYFGRATYDFQSKYLLTASFRRDGSSKLTNRWGNMPAFSAGWRISAEPFMQGIKHLDDLKIRAGWGKNGNQEGIDDYAGLAKIEYYRRTATNPLSGPAASQVTYNNPDLKWETTAQTNVGFDLSMFNSRFVMTVDAYHKKTNDVLLNVQLPSSLPIRFIQTNAGTIENKGIDFNISTVNTVHRLKWSTDFNISFNRNKVLALKYTDVYYYGRIYSNNQDVAIVKKDLPLGSFYGYVSEGVNPETGDLKFKDVNGNGRLDPGDRTIIGNGNPKFIYGLTNNLTFGRWTLNVFFQGSYGNDIYNATRIDLEGMFDSKNQSVAVLNRWTPDNRYTNIPRAVGGGNIDNVRNSTRFVEDGSYIRLKALTLSYDFNIDKWKNKGIQKVSLYATGQNLLTFTKYSGFDPEVNAFGKSATEVGIDYGTYPQAITATIGANIEF